MLALLLAQNADSSDPLEVSAEAGENSPTFLSGASRTDLDDLFQFGSRDMSQVSFTLSCKSNLLSLSSPPKPKPKPFGFQGIRKPMLVARSVTYILVPTPEARH